MRGGIAAAVLSLVLAATASAAPEPPFVRLRRLGPRRAIVWKRTYRHGATRVRVVR